MTLGFTSGSNQSEPGLNFAFNLDDEYSISTLAEYVQGGFGNTAAIVFKARSFECHHETDNFNQMIFCGLDAVRPFYAITPVPYGSEEDDHMDAIRDNNEGEEPHQWYWRLIGVDSIPIDGEMCGFWDLIADIEKKFGAA